jgi:hypothetical protein
MKEHIEDRKSYKEPIRNTADEVLEVQLFCFEEGCNKYIKGIEGYNGKFTAETGESCDLRNQCFICEEHS